MNLGSLHIHNVVGVAILHKEYVGEGGFHTVDVKVHVQDPETGSEALFEVIGFNIKATAPIPVTQTTLRVDYKSFEIIAVPVDAEAEVQS